MKKRCLIALSILGVQIYTLINWFRCEDLRDAFHMTMFDVSLIVDDMTKNDQNIPILLVRFFHNKVTIFAIEFYRHFLRFWDIPFMSNFITFVGFFGIACGLYFIVKLKKPKIAFLILAVIATLQITHVILNRFIAYEIYMPLLWASYVSLSLFGVWQFLKSGDKNKRFVFCIILILLSLLWYLVFKNDIYNYCIKI